MKVLDDKNFKEETKKGVVLVDMYADWCGPCKALTPMLEEMDGNIEGVTMVKLNVDDSPETAQEYGVMSIPTVLILKDGVEVKRLVGLSPKATYVDALQSLK
jgi:thioredoxin 1